MRKAPTPLRALLRPPPISAPRPSILPSLSTPAQLLTTSSILLKKRKIAPSSDSPTPNPSHSHSSSHPSSNKHGKNESNSPADAPDPENPLDLSPLTTSYAAADVHFRTELQQILHGGRFNPDTLGAIPITLKPSSSSPSSTNPSSGETFQLRELAQIVPRSGRTISLLVNDKHYIRDIMSSIQKSPNFNQQPQRSEDNELELFLKVELERKEDLAKRARDACRGWRERVRMARTRHEKVLQEWKRSKAVLPDVVRKVEKEMQKVQDRKMKEIDQEEAQALKQL